MLTRFPPPSTVPRGKKMSIVVDRYSNGRFSLLLIVILSFVHTIVFLRLCAVNMNIFDFLPTSNGEAL